MTRTLQDPRSPRAGLLLLLAVLISTSAVAVDREQLQARATDPETGAFPQGWALGPGVFYKSPLYRDKDRILIPVPTLYYSGKHCSIYVKKGGCRIVGGKYVKLAGLADLRLQSYDESDGDFLTGLEEKKVSLDVGLSFEVATPVGKFELEALHDVLGRHEGLEVALGWSVPVILERWGFVFAVSHHWKDSDLTGYYFGIEPNEAVPGRPAYSPGASTSWTGTTAINFRLAPRWLAIFVAEYESFNSDIKDSPIVKDSGQTRAILGFAYHFRKKK